MDYRNLFGIAAIILSATAFVRSFNSAHAFPQGPNVNMGFNPIESFAGEINNSSQTLLTTTAAPFVISDLILTMTSQKSPCMYRRMRS